MTATTARRNYDALGKEQERAIVRWARANGFPGADRIIRTGAGRGYAVRPDEGDLWLCPGVVVQSKRLDPPNRAERAVERWLVETEAQRVAARAAYALLIVRRPGTTDIGEWWAYLPLHALAWLTARDDRGDGLEPVDHIVLAPVWGAPVRMLVADATTLLLAAGYGGPAEEAT